MNSIGWWSQPVAAEGSTASEGIRRQLGKPKLDPLTVLVRETAQNTCDAALPGGGDVQYAVRITELSGNQRIAWQDFLLPEPASSNLGIEEWFAEPIPRMLSIADRGTTGLGGPLQADEIPGPGERPDFVNFIRNVGERKEVNLGGGSYGFGKGILYNVSRRHVVVADSVCLYRGRLQRRLIAAALGDGYRAGNRLFTGRHWLGLKEHEGLARPLLDDEAAEMAARLGLPVFREGETGTTVVVIDADLGRKGSSETDAARQPDDAAEFMVSTMLWNLWPRMLAGRPNRLVCTVKRGGFNHAVPDPETLPELKPYVDAYRSLSVAGGYRSPQRKQKPQDVGRFALIKAMAPAQTSQMVALAAPYDGRAHHCARMRQADLIVDYVPGEPSPDEMIQHGAVFKASGDADHYFAEAEPPTHDEWVLSGLQGTARGVVQLAGTFVRTELGAAIQRTGGSSAAGNTQLAALASRLSGLLGGAEADAATASEPPTRSSRSTGRNPNPRFIDGPELMVEGRDLILRGIIELPRWPTSRLVEIEPLVVLDGGLEPADPESARVLQWRAVESGAVAADAVLAVDRESERQWEVQVRAIPDVVLRLRIVVSEPVDG